MIGKTLCLLSWLRLFFEYIFFISFFSRANVFLIFNGIYSNFQDLWSSIDTFYLLEKMKNLFSFWVITILFRQTTRRCFTTSTALVFLIFEKYTCKNHNRQTYLIEECRFVFFDITNIFEMGKGEYSGTHLKTLEFRDLLFYVTKSRRSVRLHSMMVTYLNFWWYLNIKIAITAYSAN